MLAAYVAPKTPSAPRWPLYGTYHRVLLAALSRPRLALGATAATFAAAAVLSAALLPREMFPAVATENLEIELELPPGSDVTATDEAVQVLEAWLASRDDVAGVYAAVGAAGALDPAERGRESNRAHVRATLTSAGVDRRSALESDLRAAFVGRPGWQMRIVPDRPELASLTPLGEATFTCQVTGPDARRAEEMAAAILATAARDPRVTKATEEAPLHLEAARHEPAYRFDAREEVLARLGLSEAEALAAVQALTSGLEATTLRRFDEEHAIVIRQAGLPLQGAPRPHLRSPEGASAVAVDPAASIVVVGGRSFRVGELFEVRAGLAPARLLRENQTRVATIEWDGPLRRVDVVRTALSDAVDAAGLPSGYTVRFGGTHATMQETLSSVSKAFALSAGLVLLILAAQFESVRLPFVIFAAVPLAAVGVALALLVTRGSLNVMTGIGAVVLVGVVVNDAILKVDLLRRLTGAGHAVREAILIASRQRYRPILMTTATTTLALVPLFFGRGSELYAPLAATVIGGLVSSTLLTLIIIPLIFQAVTGRAPRSTTARSANGGGS
jgi:HAE1 family hydrophobic/amphiphilic exporter-1